MSFRVRGRADSKRGRPLTLTLSPRGEGIKALAAVAEVGHGGGEGVHDARLGDGVARLVD
jgi:hypothetical protein